MLAWIAMIILGTFLVSCGIAVCASCRQIFSVSFNSFNTPKGTRSNATRPSHA